MADLNQDLYMIGFKVVEIIVYIFCAVTIYRKKKEYILNKTYFISLLGWAVYIIFDAILFPVGHYESADLIFANLFRDIAVCAGGVLAFGFLFASIIIRYGEAKAKETKTLLLVVGGYFAFAIPTVIFDTIVREVKDSVPVVHTDFNIPSAIMIVAQILIYLIAIIQLMSIYRRIDDKSEKRRVLYFILGCLFIAIGVLFFVLLGLLNLGDIAWLTGPIGHIIWIFAPIFILIGTRKS
ncbi:MAG: hypothetical protein GF329_09645 [Candidatus Lokiarchaeota archaeon]|nr:hypothetical protein [Candidatus Lokiarchaeota archaeon]